MKKQIIRYLRLPFDYDASRLTKEVEAITMAWKAHFNTMHYEGNWTGISLRAPNGNPDSLLPETLGTSMSFEDTPLMKQCPSIKQLLEGLNCNKTSVRLLKLEKGAIIKEHTDKDLNFETGEVRLHIPIITHDDVAFYLDGDRLNMKAGECWYVNAGLPHSVSNPSPVDRIHLVVDCIVNDWLTDLFTQSDLPVKSCKDTSAEEALLQLRIIEELKRSDNLANQELAKQLEDNLQQSTEPAISVMERMISFIKSVGIQVSYRSLDDDCFLPGILIEQGNIVIDKDKLKYPGDLLHEAGHIAVVPNAERGALDADTIGNRVDHAAEEMMAIAWSYAASCHLEIEPEIVFHADGYKGGASGILQTLSSDHPFGVPMLQYAQMTLGKKLAKETDRKAYPEMLRWMRE